jgi:hypothetical protein
MQSLAPLSRPRPRQRQRQRPPGTRRSGRGELGGWGAAAADSLHRCLDQFCIPSPGRVPATYRFASFPPTRWKRYRTAPNSLRQNISTNPAIAANAEARGINASGPMYTGQVLRVVVVQRCGCRRCLIVNEWRVARLTSRRGGTATVLHRSRFRYTRGHACRYVANLTAGSVGGGGQYRASRSRLA